MNLWADINRKLVAKSLSELLFEEVLSATHLGEQNYSIKLASQVEYTFKARTGAWNNLWVEANSIQRKPALALSAAQFFIDTRLETQMSEITLGTFLEEMNNTLFSDLSLAQQEKTSAQDMANWDDTTLQQVLPGHPKLLLNKGRMGWGAQDLAHFAPESQTNFQLRWLAVARSSTIGAAAAHFNRARLIAASFQASEKEQFSILLEKYPEQDWEILPVHPWQWEQVITLQFQSELQNGRLVDLGIGGDSYAPLTSIRTLANVSRPEQPDIKLPVSILNTSCVRGLPQRYLTITPELSESLTKLCQSDEVLKQIEILGELKATGVQHPYFHQVTETSYRYHEQLGAVWRESVTSKTPNKEQTFLTAALFHQDAAGTTILEALAKKANISVAEWLKHYTTTVIIPLYHLQLKYGVGVVAHGQNIVVKTQLGLPVGLILKDFHGDLRLSNAHTNQFAALADRLTHLPPEHLIHDLITGHFITVLRFMSKALHDSAALTETQFYQVVALEIKSYLAKNPELKNPKTNLLAPTFQRVLVNKVRFKIGYGDSAERPLPMLGSELKNPLAGENL